MLYHSLVKGTLGIKEKQEHRLLVGVDAMSDGLGDREGSQLMR